MIPVVGFGAGGHAKVIIEVLRSMLTYEIVGLLDTRLERGADILGVEVLGDDSLMAELKERGIEHAFIGVGTVGDVRDGVENFHNAVGVCGRGLQRRRRVSEQVERLVERGEIGEKNQQRTDSDRSL